MEHDKLIKRYKRILAILILVKAGLFAYSIVAFGFLAAFRMLVATGTVVGALFLCALIFSGIPLKEFWEMRSFVAGAAREAFWENGDKIQ